MEEGHQTLTPFFVGFFLIISTIGVQTLLYSGKCWRSRITKLNNLRGQGKFIIYHTKTYRSARCTWLIEGNFW